MAELIRALEMFNELVEKGYIVPAGEHPNLKQLSLYRSVPSTISGGSGTGRFAVGGTNAELDSSPKGDSGHKAAR
jgi:hypothetical protein